MESEKVKEIKETLQEEVEFGKEYCFTHRRVCVDDLCDILTLINELESENEKLKNESNEMFDKYGKELQTATILIEKRNNEIIELKDRIAELEKENNEKYKRIMELEQDLIHADENVFYRECNVALREDKIKAEALKQFAERVKMEFYYEFDELIPSIMSDKIDKILKEILGE